MEDWRNIILLGNEKAGAGSSAIAMHPFVALVCRGHLLGAIDLDSCEQSFFRYLENRKTYKSGLRQGGRVSPTDASEGRPMAGEELPLHRYRHAGAVRPLLAARAAADTLITPNNDGLIEFDLLGQIDAARRQHQGAFGLFGDCPAVLAAPRRHRRDRPSDRVFMRNRTSTRERRNNSRLCATLQML